MIASVAAVALFGGCQSPLERTSQQHLREQLIASHRSQLAAVAGSPMIEVARAPSDVELKLPPQRREELDRTSGPQAYDSRAPLDLGESLFGETVSPAVQMSLQSVLHQAVRHNLDLEFARLQPAIAETRITQARAIFDAVLFTSAQYNRTNTPRPTTVFTAFGSSETETTTLTVGIRKLTEGGGAVSISTSLGRRWEPTIFPDNPSYYTADVLLALDQPLLRGFGGDVNRAQIELAGSARQQAVAELRRTLLELGSIVEQTYWNLVFARQRLMIQQQLLQRTIRLRDLIEARIMFVEPAQLTEANAFVEQRRADVIRAAQTVRRLSDELKRLINAPELPIADETLIVPLDEPVDLPLQYSVLDAMTTALRRRPDLEQLLYQVEDATVRQRVADNQRLPLLDLSARIRLNGVGNELGGAYGDVADADFVDYLVGLNFEMPIGNREREAFYRQRQLERSASVVSYQRQAQIVALEVKTALRDLMMSYQLIAAERSSRRAAAENLRALEAKEEAGAALTPEFIDLKLRRQESLAAAETREAQAIVDYNSSIARLHQAMGTLLERNGIEFQPTPSRR
jgi:outer membrane protein